MFIADIVFVFGLDLLHQKDYAIRCLCDDKFNATLELLELFAKDEIFGGVSLYHITLCYAFSSLWVLSLLDNFDRKAITVFPVFSA